MGGALNSDPSVGGRIVGRYRILRPIGQGAMATVHLARQPDLDRAVAIKELDRFGVGQSSVFALRFLREARLAGSLSHANIVTVYEYLECEGRPYIAMEYVEGGSLRQYLDGLSLSQIIGVLEGLLAALTHSEARGVVHRDIKPENILVSADGNVKIADFGIAKAYGAATNATNAVLTATGAALGTPMYMAPEQATGEPLGIATDLYAVGIVAFEMLFGYVPFGTGESPVAIVWQHVNAPVPDVRALRPDLDPRLCGWLERLLAKDPADRPASAAQALDELDEIALALLGNRRRGAAPLRPRAAATRGATPAEAAPRAPDGTSVETPVSGEAAPVTPASPQPEPPSPGSRRGVAALAVAATLVAAVGGYVLFDRDPVRPGPATSETVGRASAAEPFSDGLTMALQRLDATRASARGQMAAATDSGTQMRLAREVASAYRVAASAIAQLTPPADQRAAAQRVRDELVRTGQAYDALAQAAGANRTAGYDAGREAITQRERAVRRAIGLVPASDRAGG